ncbi:MAG: type II toxin-antitoxin system VapC family toxin [Micrococcales bacterium]|nr:type II toxin-antitoxin system VapC family toxin [Micrococcales bacterium]
MIVDTSAIVAIILNEPLAPTLVGLLLAESGARMSAATFVELCCVLDNRSAPEDQRRLTALLQAFGIEIVPFTPKQAQLARDAYRDFGRGSGHPARLNFGDCFSYALAADTEETLLFVGDDFVKTDVTPAWCP